MAKKNNFSKKTDNKKTDNKKTDNKKTIISIIICAIISVSVLSLTFAMNSETSVILPETSVILPETSVILPETSVILPETSVILPETSGMMSDYINNLSDTHKNNVSIGVSYFDAYLTDNGVVRNNNNFAPIDGIRITLNESTAEQIIDALKPNNNSVVIYPIFTSASYHEPGFILTLVKL